MRRHVKASSAGSSERSGKRRLWSLLATLALALCALGSGASSASADLSATMGLVSSVLSSSAHVTGEVGTSTGFAYYSFEYSTDGVSWTKANEDIVYNAGGPVSFDVTGLKGATKYSLRLSAHDFESHPSEVFSPGPNSEFETKPADPPVVLSIDDASSVGFTTAKVSGGVERPTPANPDPGFDLQCNFEYVADAQFLVTGFADASKALCNPNPVTAADSPEVASDLTELTPGTTYHLRLAVSNAGGSDVKVAANTFTTSVVQKPTISLNPVANLTGTGATFSAKIDPGAANSDPAFEVHWHFECQPACPGLSEESGSFGDDGVGHEVKTDASLEPNTAYTIKVVASNAGGPESDEVSFNTNAIGPAALTIPAFVLEGGTSALLGARINPHNSGTKYWFEYGTDASYGKSKPSSKDAAAGSGGQLKFFTEELTDLSLDTTYHFRVSAKNAQGEVHGEDLTFTTPPPIGPPASCPNAVLRTGPSAALPDCRAYENVTPMNLNGSGVHTFVSSQTSQVAENGEAVLWQTYAALPGVDSTGTFDTFRGRRTSDGWSYTLVSPPGFFAPLRGAILEFATPTLDRTIWMLSNANNPEDPDPTDPSVFYPDLYRSEPNGSLSWLSRGSEFGAPELGANPSFAGASADGLKVFFGESRQIEPGAGEHALYERVGQTTTVLRDENGVPLREGPVLTSADGSVAATAAPYVFREDVGHAVRVADDAFGFRIVGLSRDGSRLFFATTQSLTPDDDDLASDIYEYEVSTGSYKRISGTSTGPSPGNGEAAAEPVLSSLTGSTVYFSSTEQLDSGQGLSGEPNLYAAEGGAIHYVMTLTSGAIHRPRLTPNGRKLLFQSSDRLTAYDNDERSEVYAYDSESNSLTCVSCRPDGAPPSGDSTFADPNPLAVPSDVGGSDSQGRRIFFQSADRILPQDANNTKIDVYEFDSSTNTTSLISSGQSSSPSLLLGNGGPEGRDVFFLSTDSLTPEDQNEGSQKLFDARIGGGFPQPSPSAGCEGEGCRGAGSTKPADAAPATPSFSGPGNPKFKHKKAKKHKHKSHKKHQSKSHKRATKSNGRTGR